MQLRSIFTSALAVVAVTTAAPAQNIGDGMAYAALVITPVGGLPSTPLLGLNATDRSSFDVRYGMSDRPGSSQHRMAATLRRAAGAGQLGLTGGLAFCDGCRSAVMLGVDLLAPFSMGEWGVGLRPAVGVARTTNPDDGTSYAAALSVPISWTGSRSATMHIVPFIEPGVGYGAVAMRGNTWNGTRPMLEGGFALASADNRTALLVTAKKVFITGGTTTFGLGISTSGGR